ncbi:MAG: TIGR03915 family putative DNA repair protein, partial [Olsenella sp.]|nr:TIGR03915 family putative DNA repair protein [Olsenella sp.]
MEGVLAAIGVSYLSHAAEGSVRLCARDGFQPTLAERSIPMPRGSDAEVVALAKRVYLGLQRHTGAPGGLERPCSRRSQLFPNCLQRIAYACATEDAGAPEAIHRYVRLVFQRERLVEELIDDARVAAVDALARYAFNECERARQFVRFSEMDDGTLTASFAPRANVIPLVSQHFANRMRTERFVLVDGGHRVAALHEREARCCSIVRLDENLASQLAHQGDISDDERYVRALWKRLYDALELPGRDRLARGYDLRKGWMPMRFWGGLTELDPSSDDPGTKAPER